MDNQMKQNLGRKLIHMSDEQTDSQKDRHWDVWRGTWYIHEIIQVGLQWSQAWLDYISIACVCWGGRDSNIREKERET